MCGIYCQLRFAERSHPNCLLTIDYGTHGLLQNRGPNADSELLIHANTCDLLLAGYVLWQQGNALCLQPHSYNHHVLLLNGDIFTKRADDADAAQSDTDWLIQRIDECRNDDDLLELFRKVEGPYSILYYNRNTQVLYFVRDSLGRQSLLLAKNSADHVILSSVLAKNQNFASCIELPPLGLFRIDLCTNTLVLNPWQTMDNNSQETFTAQLAEIEQIFDKKISISATINPFWVANLPDSTYFYNFEAILSEYINNKSEPQIIFEKLMENVNVMRACDEIMIRLKNSVNDRIAATPTSCQICLVNRNSNCIHAKIGILFSGGIDCTILACLADQIINADEPIDLINVSFEKINRSGRKASIDYNTPDRLSARDSLEELRRLNEKRKWNLIEVNITRDELCEALKSRISHLAYPLKSVLDESVASVLWFGANGIGKVNVEEYTSNCRVLLIGSGADELFGGYSRHRNAFVRQNQVSATTPYELLENELNFDFNRLPSRNLARDDRVIGDCGKTARSPFLEEHFVHFVRSLRAHHKCYHSLEQGVGDKLLLRLCGYRLGLRQVASLKKRAMQFGSRVADRKQNAKDLAKSLLET